MYYRLAIPVFIIFLYSCSNPEKERPNASVFTSRNFSIKTDTTVLSVDFLNTYLLCMQQNKKLVVLDSNYQRNTSIEKHLNSYELSSLLTYNDTLFAFTKNKVYIIDTGFNLLPYLSKRRIYYEPVYADSLYEAYGNCAGEFGGAIFFRNKKTNITYSYPATCPDQVLLYKGRYVAGISLQHMGGSMSYLIIDDPSKLYEITDEQLKTSNNWYMYVDSLKNGPFRRKGVVRYEGPYGTLPLTSFVKNDSLYSLLNDDSTTYIAVHKNNRLYKRQVLSSKSFRFSNIQRVRSDTKKQVLWCQLINSIAFKDAAEAQQKSAIIVINEGKIDFVTFEPSPFFNHN